MELGWSESAPRLRSRLPNLNLLPSELLPTPLPWLTAGLVLLALGLLSLLYALNYMKTYADYEVAALRDRLAQGQQVARELGLPIDGSASLPPGTLEDWAELKARQVDWSAVFNAVANGAGAGVQVAGISQTGYTVSISGDGASTQEANQFLQRLRDSGLFASLEMSIANGPPDAAAQATPATGAQAQPTTVPPPNAAPTVVPTVAPPPAAPPTVSPSGGTVPPPSGASAAPAKPVASNPPPAAPAPAAQPSATLAPRTPLATASAVATPATAVASATPLPANDFIVQAKRETVDPAAIGNNSAIRVRVVDSNGQLIPGLRVHIDSQGDPPWSTELPRSGDNASNGTFEFPVSMGKFTAWVANGSSERATDLFTGVQGQPGVHVWDVTFVKTISGTPAAQPTCGPGCTPIPTATNTNTPAPTATPISPGYNIANLACVTTSANGGAANQMVDNNTDTWWDSGFGPIQQVTLDFSRYPNSHPRACQAKPISGSRALDPSNTNVDVAQFNAITVEAIELVTWQTDRTKATHELWSIYDNGSIQNEYTFSDVDSVDNTTLSARFSAVRTMQQLRIRTIRSGVHVGWREIRLFEPLPPAFGAWTPTPTLTPTFGATASATPTPIASATIQIASAQASSENPGNPAGQAFDGNPNSFWRPAANVSQPYIQLNFSSSQTVNGVRITTAMGESIATSTATVGPNTPTPTPAGATYHVVLLRPSLAAAAQRAAASPLDAVRSALGIGTPVRSAQDNDCFSQFVQQDNAVIQGTCGPYSNVSGVRIFIESISNAALPPGIRETTIYPPPAVVNTETPTPTITTTPNATLTVAAQSTQTASAGTATSIATTPTVTSSAQATVTGSRTVTPTDTATATFTTTPTATPSFTKTATPSDVVTPSANATAASSAGSNPPSRAVDGDPSTFWAPLNALSSSNDSTWWRYIHPNETTVDSVSTLLRMSPPTNSAGTVSVRLYSSSGIVATATVPSSPYSDGDYRMVRWATPVPSVLITEVYFTGFPNGTTPGLYEVHIFRSNAAAARAAQARPLLDLREALDAAGTLIAPRSAYAAPLEQGYPLPPGITGPLATPTPTPVQPATKPESAPPGLPPTGPAVKPPANTGVQPPTTAPPAGLPIITTPAVVGTPVSVATSFPPVIQGGSQITTQQQPVGPAAPATGPNALPPVQSAPATGPVGQPQPLAASGAARLPAAQPPPARPGRVSFVIVAQVRPGAP